MTTLPYCFFPTKVACIDDDENFAKALYFNMDKQKPSLQFFGNADKALSIINTQNKPSVMFERILQTQDCPLDCSSVSYLYEEIYNPQRYEVISCALIGEQIHGMDGLDVCRKITDPNIKKIYLTTNLEQETAIAAFNEGIIDFYVHKKDPKALDSIGAYIDRAQAQYFEGRANKSIEPLLNEWHFSTQEVSALADPLFINYFKSLLESSNIQEYYLLDLIGSFLLINTKGEASAYLTFTDPALALHMLDGVGALELEPHLWNKIGSKILPSAFCMPSLYHPLFHNFEPFVMPVQSLVLGQHQYSLAHIPKGCWGSSLIRKKMG